MFLFYSNARPSAHTLDRLYARRRETCEATAHTNEAFEFTHTLTHGTSLTAHSRSQWNANGRHLDTPPDSHTSTSDRSSTVCQIFHCVLAELGFGEIDFYCVRRLPCSASKLEAMNAINSIQFWLMCAYGTKFGYSIYSFGIQFLSNSIKTTI